MGLGLKAQACHSESTNAHAIGTQALTVSDQGFFIGSLGLGYAVAFADRSAKDGPAPPQTTPSGTPNTI